MGLNKIMMWIMGIFALIGGIDKITGCHLHLGEKFDEGFMALGELALGMTGMLCLAPTIATVVGPACAPFFHMLHLDTSIIATLISCDMGGFSLGLELCDSTQAGYFNGLFVAAMLGCTLVFSIPVAFNTIKEEDKPFFSEGLLIGIITIPVGSIISGLIAGFDFQVILTNSIFIIIISIALALSLKFIPDKIIHACMILGKLITALTYIGLVAAAFDYLTGITLIPYMLPIEDAMVIVSACGITLLGTFPFLDVLVRILKKPLSVLGKKLDINEESTSGIIFSLANSVPVYKRMYLMDKKGIVINTAWLVCATAALGDHLAFGASVAPEYLTPLILGKIAGGLLAILIASNVKIAK